jgi:hypothetical protein
MFFNPHYKFIYIFNMNERRNEWMNEWKNEWKKEPFCMGANEWDLLHLLGPIINIWNFNISCNNFFFENFSNPKYNLN